MGASAPRPTLAATPRIVPTNLTVSVFMLKRPGKDDPFKCAITSDTPPPAASGAAAATSAAAAPASVADQSACATAAWATARLLLLPTRMMACTTALMVCRRRSDADASPAASTPTARPRASVATSLNGVCGLMLRAWREGVGGGGLVVGQARAAIDWRLGLPASLFSAPPPTRTPCRHPSPPHGPRRAWNTRHTRATRRRWQWRRGERRRRRGERRRRDPAWRRAGTGVAARPGRAGTPKVERGAARATLCAARPHPNGATSTRGGGRRRRRARRLGRGAVRVCGAGWRARASPWSPTTRECRAAAPPRPAPCAVCIRELGPRGWRCLRVAPT